MTLVSPDNTAGRRAAPQLPRALALGACVWLAACAGPADDAVEVSSALGQPTGDYPGYEERVVLYATNRARVSPATEGWPTYPAQPPLQWSYQLNQSSRAHSLDMRDTPCFQHPSCDGTDTFPRVLTYYTGPWSSLAENISAGTVDPQTTVHDWIYEIGAAAGETGHRDAIFSKDLTLIGVGFAAGGMTATAKLKNFYTQDFVGTSVKRPRLTDGIHFPPTVAAGGKVTFGATYYDAAVGAGHPQVFVAVDGACVGLAFARGTTALGAYEGAAALVDGCHPYYFVATLGDGVALATYPDTGALQVGAGTAASTCALFGTARPTVTCAGMGGGGTGTGAGGAAGAGGAGAGGATGTGGMKGSGGTTGTAGATGAGGGKGAGGTTGAGGVTGMAGATGAGGATAMGAGGAPATGGAPRGGRRLVDRSDGRRGRALEPRRLERRRRGVQRRRARGRRRPRRPSSAPSSGSSRSCGVAVGAPLLLLPVEDDDLNGGPRLDGRERERVRRLVDDVGLALEELVDGLELLDRERRRSVVHRDDDEARVELVDDTRRLIGVDREDAAHGHEHDVDRPDRRELLVGQHVPEIAEVRDAQAVDVEDEDRVEAALGAVLVVVVDADAADRDVLHLLVDLGPALLVGREAAQHARLVGDERHVVVVGVLVAHRDGVRLEAHGQVVPEALGDRIHDDARAGRRLEHEARLPEPRQLPDDGRARGARVRRERRRGRERDDDGAREPIEPAPRTAASRVLHPGTIDPAPGAA